MQENKNQINKFYSEAEYLLDLWGGSTRMIHFGYVPSGSEKNFDHEQSLIETVRQVAERLELQPGLRLLDAGCGYGGPALWIARNYAVNIDGISISELHIEKAKEYARQAGLFMPGPLNFSLADYTKTGFADNTYDGIYAIESVCYAPEPKLFFDEAFRLLKPGKMLVILDGLRTRRELSSADETLMNSWMNGWGATDIDTIDECKEKLAQSGFNEINFVDMQKNFAPSHKRGFNVTNVICPFAQFLNTVGLIPDIIYGHCRASRDLWHAVQRGLCVQGIMTARKP